MERVKLVGSMMFVTALLANWLTVAAAGGGHNQVLNHRGGNATEHMSEKGFANGNAQWSADPERGWVRAEKRHELHEESVRGKDSHRQFDKANRKRKKD